MSDGDLSGQFDLSHDGKVFFTGTHNECFSKLHYSQHNSVDLALQHGGYAITKKETPPCQKDTK